MLPEERFFILRRLKNAPAGDRSTEEVREFTANCIAAFIPRGSRPLLSPAIPPLLPPLNVFGPVTPGKIIIGMEPALKLAAERHPGGRILVMATHVTPGEQKFCALMDRFSSTCRVVPLPCPGLVEYIEAGCLDTPEVRDYLQNLLSPTLATGVDAIVLGCTHFPFLKPLIQELAGPHVEILDGASGTAWQTRRRLEAENLLRSGTQGTVELHNSLNTPGSWKLPHIFWRHPGKATVYSQFCRFLFPSYSYSVQIRQIR